MAEYKVTDSHLTSIANAIRTKGGTTASLTFPAGFVTAIQNLPAGGGTYQAKTNVSPTTSSQTITPDAGYDALSSVQINAMPTGTAGIPTAIKGTVSNHAVAVTPRVTNTTGYIVGSTKTGTPVTISASDLVSGSETKTANGTYDVTNLSEIIVNVSQGGNYQAKTNISPTESAQTIMPDPGYAALSSVQINAISSTYVGSGIPLRSTADLTTSNNTVTAPAGYYANAASKAVNNGTAGTPSATKGTVSNHSVSITPTVTNTAGYIQGGTKTGTAVTVSASELVSGSETKTANGTYNVTNLAQLVVNVAGAASNSVTGTFKGTTAGAAMDVTLDYSGNGYPVAIVIYPDEGPYNSVTSTFFFSTQRYASNIYVVIKSEINTTPSYDTNVSANSGMVLNCYKNSTSDPTDYNASISKETNSFRNTSAIPAQEAIVKIKSPQSLSVFIANSSYGFMANIDYKYWVLYSS